MAELLERGRLGRCLVFDALSGCLELVAHGVELSLQGTDLVGTVSPQASAEVAGPDSSGLFDDSLERATDHPGAEPNGEEAARDGPGRIDQRWVTRVTSRPIPSPSIRVTFLPPLSIRLDLLTRWQVRADQSATSIS